MSEIAKREKFMKFKAVVNLGGNILMVCAMSSRETESPIIFLNMRRSRGHKIPKWKN